MEKCFIVTSCNRVATVMRRLRQTAATWREPYHVILADCSTPDLTFDEMTQLPGFGCYTDIGQSAFSSCRDLFELVSQIENVKSVEFIWAPWHPKHPGDARLTALAFDRAAAQAYDLAVKTSGTFGHTEDISILAEELLRNPRQPSLMVDLDGTPGRLITAAFAINVQKMLERNLFQHQRWLNPHPDLLEQVAYEVVKELGLETRCWPKPINWYALRDETDATIARLISEPSDINEHVAFLRDMVVALNAQTVLELGVSRTAVSTHALHRGVRETGGMLHSVDMHNFKEFGPVKSSVWRFTHQEDLEFAKTWDTPIDLLLIDTSHEYRHTCTELEAFAPHVVRTGCILLHDTESYPQGVEKPILEFVEQNPEWKYYRRTNCNGMGLLRRKWLLAAEGGE